MPKTAKKVTEKTLIGVDYGKTNTGVALGRNNLTFPLKVISKRSDQTVIIEISRLATENKATTIVVGLPLGAKGKETEQSKKVRKFAKLLRILTKKKVVFQNEFGSTREADEENRIFKLIKKKKRLTDHLAAALILKQYQEENL
jgi:putative transcription antitermination factor YqgF